MATILQLAMHAGLPAETVLRVLNGENANEAARARLAAAIAELGPPGAVEAGGELVPATRTVSEDVARLRALFGDIARRLRDDRRERIEDLELTTELVIEGWRGVDRRLGRIEKVLARLEARLDAEERSGSVVRLDERQSNRNAMARSMSPSQPS